ncbi:hypothetical protein [Caulobacter endophyticus]|uniref:Uncharacterized protein n=1 Tax=Caulobacter endophyticus TaxID=2172652 RepID=A0A2T9K2I3_9CAUL|nr:hypothetical protein [Caulobacter endophyticus]PVM90167.1 hypothetical protein DDF67_11225 [Caulobacter endophyticus]
MRNAHDDPQSPRPISIEIGPDGAVRMTVDGEPADPRRVLADIGIDPGELDRVDEPRDDK